MNQSLELRSDQAEVRSALGMVLLQQGRIAEATTELEQARALKPDLDKAPWLALTGAYYHLGRYPQDRELYLDAGNEPPPSAAGSCAVCGRTTWTIWWRPWRSSCRA